MNEFNNGFTAMPDGFRAVSMEELNQIEGGRSTLAALLAIGLFCVVTTFRSLGNVGSALLAPFA